MDQGQIAALLASHADISQKYSGLTQKYSGLNQKYNRLKDRTDELQVQLDWFKRQLFGTKSERRISPDESRQLTLGEFPRAEPELGA